jgi:hypothetical protein
MSQETLAIIMTVGCIALLVVWIPLVCLVRHFTRTLTQRRRPQNSTDAQFPLDAVTAYLLSGTRHEQE